MIKILKYFLYTIFFIFMMIAFLPKENLYYFTLNKLKTLKVDVSQQNIKDNYFSLSVYDADIKYENIKACNIKDLTFLTYILSTKIILNNINIDNNLNKFIPNRLDNIIVKYSLFDPLKIEISSNFKDGSCTGSVDLSTSTIRLDINLSKFFIKKYHNIVKILKKDGDIYRYEYKY
jgi:hypothetical protein